MDVNDVVDKLARVKYDNGVPQFEGPHKRVWDAMVSAGGTWLTIAQIARQASAPNRQARTVCGRLAATQTGGVRDGVKYVLVTREMPDGRWRARFTSNGFQVTVVPNPMDDSGWHSAGNARVNGPSSLPKLLPSQRAAGEATS